MNIRKRLPNRRPCRVEALEVAGQTFTACVGFDPITGRPSEIFLDAPKRDSMFGAMLTDAAVVISIALQSDIPPAALAKSIGRLPIIPVGPADLDNPHSGQEPSSPIGAALDLLGSFDQG